VRDGFIIIKDYHHELFSQLLAQESGAKYRQQRKKITSVPRNENNKIQRCVGITLKIFTCTLDILRNSVEIVFHGMRISYKRRGKIDPIKIFVLFEALDERDAVKIRSMATSLMLASVSFTRS